MFFKIPNTENSTYGDGFMTQDIYKWLDFPIYALIAFIFLYICLKLVQYIKKKKTQRLNNYNLINQSQLIIKSQDNNKLPPSLIQIIHKIAYVICLLSFLTSIIGVEILIMIYFSYGKFGFSTGINFSIGLLFFVLGIIAIILFQLIASFSFQNIKNFFATIPQWSIRQKIITPLIILGWASICFCAIYFSRNMCICEFTKNYGIHFQNDWQYSTYYMRSRSIQKPCPDKKICHFYATLPQNTDTDVFFNIHTGIGIQKVTIQFQQVNIYQTSNVFGQVVEGNLVSQVNDVEDLGSRMVYSNLIQNLKPSTLYLIKVYADDQTYVTKYKTLPQQGSNQPLTIVFGGDVGLNEQGQILTRQLAQINPDVILIGGDVTYDDGMRTCYYSWDLFFSMFEQVNLKINRTIPIIYSVGNHDVGFDLYSQAINKVKSYDKKPYFFQYLPQHYGQKEGLPSVQQRLTYHYHKIGNTIHLFLDSGYMVNHQNQAEFIDIVSLKFSGYKKFANYHNPIYPSCFENGTLSWNQIKQGQYYWVPRFQKYGFIATMQHHQHQLKKTLPIIQRKKNDSGVLYLGDGSWGVTQKVCSNETLSYMQKYFGNIFQVATNDRHFWSLQSRDGIMNFTAYGFYKVLYNFTRQI